MNTPELYPGATWRPSSVSHPDRIATLGIVLHRTYGRAPGELRVLDGPDVDVQFDVLKVGEVVQFTRLESQAWHAYRTANAYMIGIETEGGSEPWTDPQGRAVVQLCGWLSRRYSIPVRMADPSGHALDTFRGITDHRHLSVGGARVDGNNHTDAIGMRWAPFIAQVQAAKAGGRAFPVEGDGTLRLAVEGHAPAAGWRQAAGMLRWIDAHGLQPDTRCALAWRGHVWHGAHDVTNVARNLCRRFL